MSESKVQYGTDVSTEEKIKTAARKIFLKHGFAGTRIRDIAAEADINLALLNYYFRSKQKLFDIIMMESMQEFVRSIKEVLENESTALNHKIETVVNRYIDLLISQPHIPLFILSELQRNPEALVAKIGVSKIIQHSSFLKQFIEGIHKGEIVPIHPLHFIVNILSMTIFPFIASPMIKGLGNLSDADFLELMNQRRKLIPLWIENMMKKR